MEKDSRETNENRRIKKSVPIILIVVRMGGANFLLRMMLLIIGACLLPRCLTTEKVRITHVTIAILAKNKAHTLPLYLRCIERQTWPKIRTSLYVHTNDNTDESETILSDWLARVSALYANVFFSNVSVNEQLRRFGQHEWNALRFKILGRIRQDSIEWARRRHSHYFVADCDNFIVPDTIESLVHANALPIVAPMLRTGATAYSNFHAAIDANGYFANSPFYDPLLRRELRGFIEVPVVHCTYLVRFNVLAQMLYDDDSARYEYVIFSDNARKRNISQFLDNHRFYGRITFAETATAFAAEPWLGEFN